MTGASASCFGEQYRDLLLYLHQKLDENNCNQQVQTDVQQYIQYTMVTLYFLQMVIPLMLFANKERSSTERRMECGIADETSIPSLKCEYFGLAALGQPPSWVHAENTGLTASTMNVRCHAKHENERRSLYCSSSSHQKSVSAYDESKHNKPSPSSPEPTS